MEARRRHQTFRQQRDSLQILNTRLEEERDAELQSVSRLQHRLDSVLASMRWLKPPTQAAPPYPTHFFQSTLLLLLGLDTLLIFSLLIAVWKIAGAVRTIGGRIQPAEPPRLPRSKEREHAFVLSPATPGMQPPPAGNNSASQAESHPPILFLLSENSDRQLIEGILADLRRRGLARVECETVSHEVIELIEQGKYSLLLYIASPQKRQGIEMDQLLHGVVQALQNSGNSIPLIVLHESKSGKLSVWDEMAIRGYDYAVIVQTRLEMINQAVVSMQQPV